MFGIRWIFAILVSCLTLIPPARCATDDSVESIIAFLEARDSAITSIQYTMTKVWHRTTEGTKLLAEQPPPGEVLELDDSETPIRHDFTRMRQGEKDRLEQLHYQDDLETIAGHILRTWDGSIGKVYVPETRSGRVERQRFRARTETVERASFEVAGKTLATWLRDTKDTAKVTSTGDLLEVTFQMMDGVTARCILDKTKAYAVTHYDILKGGEVSYTMSMHEFQHCVANGVDVFIPCKYEATNFFPRVNSRKAAPKPDMVPLTEAQITVTSITLNAPISDDQFVIKFPAGTRIYDEFLGRFLPRASLEPNDIEASIRAQAKTWRSELMQDEPTTQADAGPSPASAAAKPVPGKRSFPVAIGSAALIACCVALIIVVIFVMYRSWCRRKRQNSAP